MPDPFDPRRRPERVFDSHYVEPDPQPRQIGPLLQQPCGRSGQPPSLSSVNARSRPTESLRGARAHFHERKLLATAGDDVELTAPAAVIAQQHLRSLSLEEPRRSLLGSLAEAQVRCRRPAVPRLGASLHWASGRGSGHHL